MNYEELASQLSAMFDGELPAVECELLSRRLGRDEHLRGRWSRYAAVGAVMRSEPVAAVRGDFARRVSAAIISDAVKSRGRANNRRKFLWNTALGAGLAGAVAGLAIVLLRSATPAQDEVLTAYTPTAVRASLPQGTSRAGVAAEMLEPGESVGYVVPPSSADNSLALPASLANFVVAHSEYSSPLVRRNLLSALVGSDATEFPPAAPAAPADRASVGVNQ